MPSSQDVLVSVAYGHAFADHAHEFNSTGRFSIKNETDLLNLARDVLDSPHSKAILDINNNRSVIIDFDKKVMIGLSNSKQYGDAGSIYPITNPQEKYQSVLNDIANNPANEIRTPIISRDLQDVKEMLERFAQTEDFSKNTLIKMESPSYQAAAQTASSASTDINRLNAQIEAINLAAVEAETSRVAQARAQNEAAALRGRILDAIKAEAAADAPNFKDGKGGILMQGKDGTTYEIRADVANETAKIQMTDAAGAVQDVEVSGRQFKELFHIDQLGLKGIAKAAIGPVLVFGLVFAQTKDAQAASNAAIDSMAHYSVNTPEGVSAKEQAIAAVKDLAAMTAPETVKAIHEERDLNGIGIAAAHDTAVAGGCLGGAVSGASLGAMTGPGAIVASPVLGVAGCLGGGYLVDGVVRKTNQAIDNVVDYFYGTTDEVSLDDVRMSLPSSKDTLARQPELQALSEVKSSDILLRDRVQDLRAQGSADHILPQLEERRASIAADLPIQITPEMMNTIRLRPAPPPYTPANATSGYLNPFEAPAGIAPPNMSYRNNVAAAP